MSKPIVKIQTLEDSPSWVDQQLVSGYLATTYRVVSPPCDIRIGEANAALEAWMDREKAFSFTFITAANPHSQPLPPEENQRRNEKLKAWLCHFAQLIVPSVGIGDRGDYPPEAGFCVLGLAPEEAIAAGLAFDQNAIVYGWNGELPELWWLAVPLSGKIEV